MKKILKLITTLIAVTPVPLNIIACDSSDDSDNQTEPVEISGLIDKAKTKIKIEFGKLVDNNNNLTFQGQFNEHGFGRTIREYLEKLNDKAKINQQNIKKAFYEIINNDIKNKIIPSLLADTSLQTLFNGIATNVLTLDLSQTILTNNNIEYGAQGGRFGIQDYNPNTFKLTFLKEIVTNLALTLSYKDQHGKIATNSFEQSYTIYFANTGANINEMIRLATINIEKNLKITY